VKSRIFRHTIPVDDQAHYLDLNGPIVHVATRDPRFVEVWAVENEDAYRTRREFVVVGTGHPYNHFWKHVGTAIDPSGLLVWHLMEVPK
jgi:hypothetical protein